MAIQFEFYKNPQPEKEGEEPSYHPRVVNFQHVTTQRLAKEIHMATTFGKAEVEAMLMELSRCMGNHLREGERVHLDGIGYFQITLQAAEPIHSLTTRADKVKLKSINFQADRDLKSANIKTVSSISSLINSDFTISFLILILPYFSDSVHLLIPVGRKTLLFLAWEWRRS